MSCEGEWGHAAGFFSGIRVTIGNGRHYQMVRIWTAANEEGDYRWVVRCEAPPRLTYEDLQQLARLGWTPEDLVARLQAERDGMIEHGLPVPLVGPVGRAYTPAGDPWVTEAVSVLEEAINTFVLEFLDTSLVDRVEHSLHVSFMHRLRQHPQFATHMPLAHGHGPVQVVQKEWGEAVPLTGHRRGNYDVAILPPDALRVCSVPEYLEALLPAPIVIECGLDYDLGHLPKDAAKLIRNDIPFPYLLHLVQSARDEPGLEGVLLRPGGRIKTAYARAHPKAVSYKLLGDQGITRREKARGSVIELPQARQSE